LVDDRFYLLRIHRPKFQRRPERPSISNFSLQAMPLMESLFTFLQPVGWRFNIQNRNNQKFVIPFIAPGFAEHQMKRRGALNQRAGALIEAGGFVTQSCRMAIQLFGESHNWIVERAPPIWRVTQLRALCEMLVHFRYASFVAE